MKSHIYPHKIVDFLPFPRNSYFSQYIFECRRDEYHNGVLAAVHLHSIRGNQDLGKYGIIQIVPVFLTLKEVYQKTSFLERI